MFASLWKSVYKNGHFQADYYPQTITETVLFDAASEVVKQKNALERLWAYLTIQNLLKRVAR